MTKGLETRERIVEHAARLASRDGLEGVSIGVLAHELGLSKSGLFAHFGSKEALQLEILRSTAEHFEAEVILPAIQAPRGEPRVRALFERWKAWHARADDPGGCVFMAASVELDDRPGAPRDYLAGVLKQFMGVLTKAALVAMQEGHFRGDLDPKVFAFEWHGLMASWNQSRRLFRDPAADFYLNAAFERLLHSARLPA
jgi:AcrR family transcriptional regulator